MINRINNNFKYLSSLFSYILFGLFITHSVTVYSQDHKPELSIEAIVASGEFYGEFFQGGQWTGTGPVITYIYVDPSNGISSIKSFDLEKNEHTLLLHGSILYPKDINRNIRIEDYEYSADNSKILIYTDSEPVWRQNTKGYYYIYNIEKETTVPLSARDKGYQLFAKFSPDGKYIGFVRKRNLYIVDLESKEEIQLTFDGSAGKIINGTSDWVYEEEFSLRDGWAWSPDSRYITFFQFDESRTSEFVMTDLRGKKPRLIKFKFPLAGEQNSEVRIGIINIEEQETQFFETDTWNSGGDEHEYIPRIGWTPLINGKHFVWILRLNRDQNKVDLLYGNPDSHEVITILQEKEDTWVEVFSFTNISPKITYLEDGKHFIWRSEEDGYNHLYLYKNDGELLHQITSGKWDVTDFYGVDVKTDYAYFSSTKENPMERHLYKININKENKGSNDKQSPIKITKQKGIHEINISNDFKYYIDTYSNRNSPNETNLFRINGEFVNILEDNAELKKTLKKYNVPQNEFITVPADDGTLLNAFILKPTDFDPDKKYPLLMYNYSGPADQTVLDLWDGFFGLWFYYLAEKHDIIITCVDNRGTSGRGKKFASINYKKLGTIEPLDQIAAAKYFGKLPYIDEERIGIWGWSYGGYNTLLSMMKYDGPKIFKLGIAAAPVIDFGLYNTIYTERYMSTPQKNPEGYKQANVTNYVDRLKNNQKLLIVHGDLDDNAHYQNTVQLISALQAANKQFRIMIYPGGKHSLQGTGNPYVYLHLLNMLTDFLVENL